MEDYEPTPTHLAAELAPLPADDDDDEDDVIVCQAQREEDCGQSQPGNAAPALPSAAAAQSLRPDAKPFVPTFASGSILPPPSQGDAHHVQHGAPHPDQTQPFDSNLDPNGYFFQGNRRQRQVTVTRAHYDEEGNVMYPARVSTVQNPEVMRYIAERDLRNGFRSGSKKQQAPGQAFFPQPVPMVIQTPTGPMLMMVNSPPQPVPSQPFHHQPAFAVFNKQAPNSTAAIPVVPVQAPAAMTGLGHLDDDPDRARSLASALMDPITQPPPKYTTYNPFSDTALDKHMKSLEALLDGQDDDGDNGPSHSKATIVDPLWLLNEVKRVEERTAVPSNTGMGVTAVKEPGAHTAAAAPLLNITTPLTTMALREDVTHEPIGPSKSTGPVGTVALPSVGISPVGSAAPSMPPPYAAFAPPTASTGPKWIAPQSTGPSGPVLPPPASHPYRPTAASFVPNLGAKPYVPSPAAWTTPNVSAAQLPSYNETLTAKGIVPAPTGTNSSLYSGNDSIGPAPSDDSRRFDDIDSLSAPTTSLESLKVNPEAFFSDDARHTLASAAPASRHAGDSSRPHVNPFSLQSLQGVRRTEHAVPLQQVVWQRVFFRDSETWVPPPFTPMPNELVRLHNGQKHYDVTKPLSHPSVVLHLYNYQCATCNLSHIYPGKLNNRPADVKLGGVCGDVPALCIAHMIEVITGVKIVAIDMFGNNLGRCNLWLQDSADVVELTKKFDRKMWMSPVFHGYAVVALDDDGREYLHWYLEGLRAYGPKAVRFPRHLVTCERWIA